MLRQDTGLQRDGLKFRQQPPLPQAEDPMIVTCVGATYVQKGGVLVFMAARQPHVLVHRMFTKQPQEQKEMIAPIPDFEVRCRPYEYGCEGYLNPELLL